MLGKLIKHDYKATYKTQCGMYILLFLLSLIAMVGKILQTEFPGNIVLTTVTPVFTVTSIIARVAVFAVTMIMSVLRYRRNVLKDEGYLMHTLPVKKWEILVSKLIVPYSWMIVNVAAVVLSIALEKRSFDFLRAITLEINAMEITTGVMVLFVVAIALSLLSSLSLFYLCLNAGYSFSKDRDLMSFVMYIVLYIINQIVNTVGMGIILITTGIEIDTEVFPVDYFTTVFTITLVMTTLMCIVYNGISVYLLNKKLNLE